MNDSPKYTCPVCFTGFKTDAVSCHSCGFDRKIDAERVSERRIQYLIKQKRYYPSSKDNWLSHFIRIFK